MDYIPQEEISGEMLPGPRGQWGRGKRDRKVTNKEELWDNRASVWMRLMQQENAAPPGNSTGPVPSTPFLSFLKPLLKTLPNNQNSELLKCLSRFSKGTRFYRILNLVRREA